ncbi:capsular exopolysaccharide synthesis family protein [Evansella vedderi]|uniref:non-specific protein-tyrosine kinase n=1 Tax=Evansella vedderi TaxID=38282 RepID=A0ABT9ZQZ3_9BACI|nr:CpsD/CapB family tyrosine-protein kinase [Evansella vedderi]MDQ0253152.1 capsular exopolysaccharide synthesis family protein [Evansella vedderi]
MITKILKRSALIIHNDGNDRTLEEYESMQLNIEFLAFERKCKTLLFTSPGSKEGKSTTVANLGISLARSGKKVLLVDAHVKKPSINQLFKIKNSLGLTNILAGQRAFGDTINQTEVENLKVITSGPIPYNTEKLFRSNAMEVFLKQAALHFDYVLLDGPPVLDEVDTKVLTNKCDGTILVIRNGKTEDELALEAKKALDIAKGKVIGVVLNRKRRTFSFKKMKGVHTF